MKRVVLTLACVLSALCAFGQDTQSSSGDSVAGDFSPRTFRGCLVQSAGDHYDLIVAGVTPRQYHLAGSNLAQLEGKSGHTVSITGTVPNTMPVGTTNVDPESDTINFLAVDDLSTTCRNVPGPTGKTTYSRAAAIASAQDQYLRTSSTFLSEADLRAEAGNYMVVPMVGALALGLLQVARYRRRK
ncbi:MAG TPA: hypothetical protein VM578_12955 [Candidatus Saccharimonadales bacterium]|nr:hypothetical protein [Candidatus Saccharimonadales bacterium]